MAQWLLLLALPILSLAASASDGSTSVRSSCELAIESAFTITKAALEHRVLTPEDIQFMIEDPHTIRNPYARSTKGVGNLSFRQKFERHFQNIPTNEMPALRQRLEQLYQAGAKDREQIAEARENTEFILAPKLIQIPELLKVADKQQTYWHKDKDGDLQLVSYDPYDLVLQIFPLTNPNAVVRHSLASSAVVRDSVLQGETKFISLPDGNLIVAHLVGLKKQIVVHDTNANRTTLINLSENTETLHLALGPDQKVYVVAQSNKHFSTYEVEGGSARRVHHVSVPDRFSSSKVLRSSDGQVLLVFADHTRVVHTVNPLTHKDRSFRLKDQTEGIRGIFLADGRYILALTSKARNSPSYRITFLDSESDEPRFTPYFKSGISNGGLFQTSEGKVYLAVGVNSKIPNTESRSLEDGVNVHVYEAQQMPPSGNLWNLLTRTKPTITPELILNGETGIDASQFLWLEPSPGRVVFAQASYNPNFMSVYEFNKTYDSISNFADHFHVKYIPRTDDIKVELTPVATRSKYVVQIHTRAANKTEFFEATQPPVKIGEIPERSVLPAIVDRRGITYILTDNRHSGVPWSTPRSLHLYQLTVGDPR